MNVGFDKRDEFEKERRPESTDSVTVKSIDKA